MNRTRYDRDVILYYVYDTTCVWGDIFFLFVCDSDVDEFTVSRETIADETKKKGSCEGPVSSIESEFVRSH